MTIISDIGGGRYRATKSGVATWPAVDTRKLCVPCVITTQDEDREKDVILTAGIDLINHRANPLVMLDHGLFPQGKIYPAVARAEDPDGVYTVTFQDGTARAVSWFSEKIQDSYQTFQLIAEGFLRGVSIGFRPLVIEARRKGKGYLVKSCELLEYSHCPMGVNPHALADRIGKGYLGSERITPALWATLVPHLPKVKTQVSVPTIPPAMQVKSQSNGQPKKVKDQPMTTKKQDRSGDEAPPGARVMAGVFIRLTALAAFVEEGRNKQEQPNVTTYLASLGEQVERMRTSCTETFTLAYSDLDISEVKALGLQGHRMPVLSRELVEMEAKCKAARAEVEQYRALAENAAAQLAKLQGEVRKRQRRRDDEV